MARRGWLAILENEKENLIRVNGQLTRGSASIKSLWRRQRENTPLFLLRFQKQIMAVHKKILQKTV